MNDSSRAQSRERFSLEHQIAVVTGACGKLGPIWIEALVDAGARVAALELPGAPESTAFRAVGAANGKNPISIVAPCHRVIGTNGALTGFAGGLEGKAFLLQLEGAAV